MKKFSSEITVLLCYSVHDNVWMIWLFIREFPIAVIAIVISTLLKRYLKAKRTRAPVYLTCSMVEDGKQQLQAWQDRQKRYYDRSTKGLPELNLVDVLRVRHNNEWVRGVVNSKQCTPQSYNIVTEKALMFRRNRRDVIRTAEDPPTTSHLPADESFVSKPPSDQPAATSNQPVQQFHKTAQIGV